MPQMMPLNWILLMLFFSLIFYMIFTNLYYNYPLTSNSSSSQIHFNNLKMNWMW
nr:ATP synthase F0 subunit 8 [Cheumatopsyche sp. XG-2022]